MREARLELFDDRLAGFERGGVLVEVLASVQLRLRCGAQVRHLAQDHPRRDRLVRDPRPRDTRVTADPVDVLDRVRRGVWLGQLLVERLRVVQVVAGFEVRELGALPDPRDVLLRVRVRAHSAAGERELARRLRLHERDAQRLRATRIRVRLLERVERALCLVHRVRVVERSGRVLRKRLIRAQKRLRGWVTLRRLDLRERTVLCARSRVGVQRCGACGGLHVEQHLCARPGGGADRVEVPLLFRRERVAVPLELRLAELRLLTGELPTERAVVRRDLGSRRAEAVVVDDLRLAAATDALAGVDDGPKHLRACTRAFEADLLADLARTQPLSLAPQEVTAETGRREYLVARELPGAVVEILVERASVGHEPRHRVGEHTRRLLDACDLARHATDALQPTGDRECCLCWMLLRERTRMPQHSELLPAELFDRRGIPMKRRTVDGVPEREAALVGVDRRRERVLREVRQQPPVPVRVRLVRGDRRQLLRVRSVRRQVDAFRFRGRVDLRVHVRIVVETPVRKPRDHIRALTTGELRECVTDSTGDRVE